MVRFGLLASACCSGLLQVAAAQLTASVEFQPAELGRTHMDVGGAWSGSADVSAVGDRIQLTLSNPDPTETAFDISFTATLPAGFTDITTALNTSLAGSGSCGAAPSINATRSNDDLIFDTTGFDLPALCDLTLDFGLTAPAGTPSGTYTIGLSAEASTAEGDLADLFAAQTESFLVQNGAIILEKNPNVTNAKFGDVVTWEVTVRNSGLGGIFDLDLSELGIGSGLSLDQITPLQPVTPTPIVSGASVLLPYLASGETLSAAIEATVSQCTGLTNTAALTERTSLLSATVDATVQLELETPEISYSVVTSDVPYAGTGSITLTITNSGDGDAQNFGLDTSLVGAALAVVSTSAGWSYDSGTGRLSKDDGSFLAGATESVTLTVSDAGDVCSVVGSIPMSFTAEFEDDCGTVFTTPAEIAQISLDQVPNVSLSGGSVPRLSIGQSGSLTLTLSANELDSLDTDPVSVTYTLPPAIQAGALLTPSAGSTVCIGSCGAGDVVTWTVPRASLSSAQTLTVGITTSTDACDAGASYATPAEISTTFAAGACPLADSASTGFLLSTYPNVAATQVFNQSGSPFETGTPDDGDGLREEGEGEEAQFSASYFFDVSDAGVWTGSTYVDDFGGIAAATLTPDTLEYRLNGGAWVAVPTIAITNGSGSLTVELDFLASVDSSAALAGDSLEFRYQLTAPDSVLGGAQTISTEQFATLSVSSGTNGGDSCPAAADVFYSQGDRVTWQRAAATLGVTLNDSVVDVCEVVDAQVTIGNQNNQFPIRNLLATLDLGSDYELVTPSDPVFAGGLGTGASVTYDALVPDFELNDETLSSQGAATIQVRRRATASDQGGALGATLDYDDNETAPAGARRFQSTASDTPFLVNTAELDVFVSPSTLPATTDTVSWAITVRNVDSGTAFNTVISDIIPAGLNMDAADVAAMDLVNSFSASVAGDTVSWDVGDLAPGASVVLNVVASVDGSTCSIPNGSNQVNAQWGCGGFTAQSVVNTRPDISFPSGQMEVIHDTTGAYASLCGAGQIVIRARNNGISEVTDVTVTELLNTATTGISLISGSVEYSNSDGASWTSASGISPSSTLLFDASNIPPLALLAANGQSGDEVLIRFGITTTAQTNSNSSVTASGSGSLHCGDAVTSPGSAFSVPIAKPRMRVSKVGRNVTRGGVNGEKVYAAPGETVEWTVTVQNDGDLATSELRLRDILAGSNGAATISGPGINQTVTADYVVITDIAAGGSATYTITEILGSTCVTAPNTADVTWGCIAQSAGQASELSSPIDNEDVASLIMVPLSSEIDIVQTTTDASGAGALTTNGHVTLEITNNGAPFTAAALTNTLPTGFRFDPAFTPLVSTTDAGTDAYDAVSIDSSNVNEPIITLTRGGAAGYLRHGETFTVEFAIYQDGSLDTQSDATIREETMGSSDPDLPVDSNNSVVLSYESGCGISGSKSDVQAVAPITPDLDIDIADPISRIVSGTGVVETYTVNVTNNGETTAENGQLEIVIGTGWSGAAPSGCVGAIPGTLTCDLSGASALASGATRSFALNLTVANEAGDLGVSAEVTGIIKDADDVPTGGNYSLDLIEAQTLGFRQTLSLHSTSEADFAAAGDVQIGEEAVLRIESVWFGGGASLIETPVIELDFERLTGFSRISETVTTSQAITNQTNFGSGAPSAIVYEFADFTGGNTVAVDVVVRALNNGANTAGQDFEFVSTASSEFASLVFDDSVPGFPTTADRTERLTFERPVLDVTKEVRNLTLSGSFAATAEGDAADVFEYRIQLVNTGSAPAFDLSIVDTVPDGFTIAGFSGDGLDNDGDGSSDEVDEGGVSGQVITFDRGTTDEGKLAQLGPGETLTLLYQTTANATVNPSASAINSADYLFDTLNGVSGSQTAPTGANNDSDGAFEDGDTVTATVRIDAVDLIKSLTLTSVGGDTSTDVVVGERADFQLSIVLPAGTAEDFLVEDLLPEGMALVARDPVVFGSGVSCASSTVLPGTLPASGAPLTASWDFGTCTVADVAAADRTVLVSYTGQVENIASVEDGDTLTNAAQYNHSGLSEALLATPVDLAVTEPRLTLTLDVSSGTNIDAGSPMTLTYVLSNAGTAPAFNIDLATVLNDNGVDDGADGDVNTDVTYGNSLRDVQAFNCDASNVADASASLGNFLFNFDPADGDGDATDEDADCSSLYQNIFVDGFAAGASLTFVTEVEADASIVMETDYNLETIANATSLPAGNVSSDDSLYERSAANDSTSSGRYESSASDTFSTRDVAATRKTFTATSDALTTPESGNAINVAIGETYTAEVTYRFDEGITHDVTLRELVRLDSPTMPADVEFVSARLRRTDNALMAEDNPANINSIPAGDYVDITLLISENASGNNTVFSIDVGDVIHSGSSGSLDAGRDLQSYVIEYTLRVRDVTFNQEAIRIRDVGQTRMRDGDGVRLPNQGGNVRYATIVGPELTVAKTSSDLDGILSGNEAVAYSLEVSNIGTGPAYNAVLEDTLPLALRAAGPSGINVIVDGVAPTISPVFSYNSATGLARWKFDEADALLPNAIIEITYTAIADATVAPGSVHTNAFEVAAYYSQASSQPVERRQYDRSNTASVTLGAPEIAFIPDQSESTQPGSTVIYPHILEVPASLAAATLDFSSASSQGLEWQIWYDTDGNGVLSGGDIRWTDGATLPTTGSLQFFAQTQVPTEAHDGWRDVTVTTASLTQGSVTLTGQVTDITTVSRLQAGELTAAKSMAIDRDCDGSLSDESTSDATFEGQKGAAPGECVIYRISFRNEGTGAVTNVDVRDMTPAFTIYVGGSAAYETTPTALTPGTPMTPAANDSGPLSFPYSGSLPSGDEGAVTYGVRVGE
ncbi:MAG: hypothetical protein AAFZ91_00095 [Pseudomonadota bacterium]